MLAWPPPHSEAALQAELKARFALLPPPHTLPPLPEVQALAGLLLQASGDSLATAHRAGGGGGRMICGLRAQMMDGLLSYLWELASASWRGLGKTLHPLALVANGGYGRRELCPQSDVDLMLLLPDSPGAAELKPQTEHFVRHLIYPLWDLKLKVGHSVRTIEDAQKEARQNNHSKNALLDARYLVGDRALYDDFSRAWHNFCQSDDPVAYLQLRLHEQTERRTKHGNTVFLQEPEIKNGVGGLRDYQNALWMSRIKLGLATPEELLAGGWLKPEQYRDFTTAYDFLLRTRTEVHLQLKRPNDRLDLELQPICAAALGFGPVTDKHAVEGFMRAYYGHARHILRVSQVLEQRLALVHATSLSFDALLEARFFARPTLVDGFILSGGKLATANRDVFVEDPVRLIRVFRHLQQYEATLDYELASLIHDNLPLLDDTVRRSPAAARSFRSILQQPGAVYPVVGQMHDLGVLGRYLPEFEGLTCLIQHEYYHRYTADIHTLNCLAELDAIHLGERPEAGRLRAALNELEDPNLLYVMLLLHDIGKSGGIKGHSERGVEMARPVLSRLGFDPASAQQILFIIGAHLEMARFWQHRDINDPQVVQAFAEVVRREDLLHFLYVLTYCDVRGTANGLWNSYKDMLHSRLHSNTLEALRHRDALAGGGSGQSAPTLDPAELQRLLPQVSLDEIEAHFSLLPDRYYVHTLPSEIALHVTMVHDLLQRIANTDSMSALVPVIDWRDDLDLSLTVVNVVTWDRAGLFYKLAGAFSVAGLNIISSKVMSRSDHITIDTFYVSEPGGGVVQNAKARETFSKTVENALLHNTDLETEIVAQARRLAKPSWLKTKKTATVAPQVDIYHDAKLRRTIVEVQGKDRIGLLYSLAKVLYENHFDISFARISTERGVAVDTIYIEPVPGSPAATETAFTRLQTQLLDVLSKDPVEAAA